MRGGVWASGVWASHANSSLGHIRYQSSKNLKFTHNIPSHAHFINRHKQVFIPSDRKVKNMLQIISIFALWCASIATAHLDRDLSWGSHNGMFYSLISATNFVESSGAVETITTPDGIRAVGFLDPGDTMGYMLDVPIAGMYSLLLRLVSPDGEGELTIGNAETSEIYALFEEFPSSNGSWEDYQTIGQTVTLPQGQFMLQVSVLEAGFNLMWMSLEQLPQEPFQAVESEESLDPAAPEEESEPAVPVDPVAPEEPAAPVDPVVPEEQSEPVEPAEPDEEALTAPPTQAVTASSTVTETKAPTLAPTMRQTPALTVDPAVTELSMYTEQCFSAGNFLTFQGCDVLPRGVGSVGPLVASTMITYPFQVAVSGVYLLQMSVQGKGGLTVTCESSGTQYAYIESLPAYRTTSTSDVWYTVSTVMSLSVGMHNLQVEAMVGGWSIQSLCLLPVASHSVSCSVGAGL